MLDGKLILDTSLQPRATGIEVLAAGVPPLKSPAATARRPHASPCAGPPTTAPSRPSPAARSSRTLPLGLEATYFANAQ
ncbi:MAG: hypothetical protein R2854_26145 [Caldilineaceae bacterium]